MGPTKPQQGSELLELLLAQTTPPRHVVPVIGGNRLDGFPPLVLENPIPMIPMILVLMMVPITVPIIVPNPDNPTLTLLTIKSLTRNFDKLSLHSLRVQPKRTKAHSNLENLICSMAELPSSCKHSSFNVNSTSLRNAKTFLMIPNAFAS